MPLAEFEPTIPVRDLPQSHALGRAVTRIRSLLLLLLLLLLILYRKSSTRQDEI